MTRRFLLVSLVAAVAIATVPVVAAPATAGQASGCSDRSSGTDGLAADAHPVVLVHGWTGEPLGDTRTALEGRLARGWQFRLFDYHRSSTQWAAEPAIARCLAQYVERLSDSHRAVGGDGLVYLVTHSMGGLAVRFAADPRYGGVKDLPQRIGGLVTLGTPHQGSPWGNSGVYSGLLDVVNRINFGALPSATSKASSCLAAHAAGEGLPAGCAPPPYLPTTIPVTQVAGAATVTRRLFGLRAYDISLGGDGIVPTHSAHGYIGSAPRTPVGQIVRASSSECGMDMHSLLALAGTPLLGSIAQMRIDGSAMDAISQGRTSPALLEFTGAALMLMPCGHSKLLTNGAALDQVAQALQEQTSAGVTVADLRNAPVPSLCEHPAGRLVDGSLPGLPPGSGEVTLVDTLLGDLDGDGRNEGVATMQCTYGGNANYLGVWVYGRGPTLLGRADIEGSRPIQRSRGVSLGEVRIVDGQLEVNGLDGDEDDSTAGPSVYLSRRFTVSGGRVTAVPVTAPRAAEPLTGDGWGSWRVGDSYGVAARLTGWSMDVDDINGDDPGGSECTYVHADGAPDEVFAQGGSGTIRSVVTHAPGLKTAKGVGVGSSEADVLTAYGSAVRRTDNEYVEIDDVVVEAGPDRVLRFQFDDEDRRVIALHGGEVSWAMLIEGCA